MPLMAATTRLLLTDPCNNQTFTGGGIFTQSTEVIDAFKMTGGEITGNVAARMGAGICASLWYPGGYYDGSGQVIAHQNMDLEISGGKISGNMSGGRRKCG